MKLQLITNRIYTLRGQRVMLDYDLAELYDVETKALNQAVKRNRKRFPADFMFRLSVKEWENMRSQFVTASQGRRNTAVTPYAFTEQGFAMLSGILQSEKAVKVNIAIMRAFVKLRHLATEHKDIMVKLKAMETMYDRKFKTVDEALIYLFKKDNIEKAQRQRVRIGFKK